ncbi:MAG: hypothetical protein NTX96_00895 [Candidatus Zambryskibacteria bacterium]|nr:hypothetical protein [Candidatus Zambryskibacteria bacterium]
MLTVAIAVIVAPGYHMPEVTGHETVMLEQEEEEGREQVAPEPDRTETLQLEIWLEELESLREEVEVTEYTEPPPVQEDLITEEVVGGEETTLPETYPSVVREVME